MQIQSKFHRFKNLRIVLGNQTVSKFSDVSVLLVGVGGIGCEVLKSLSKLPVKKIVIIDLDVIELTNLNRQFYFGKGHLRQSKSKVARQQILKLVPDLSIEAIQGSIYDKQYDNYHFYSQFSVVISALDNMKARQYLAKNCTKYDKVMIDAGTSGFNGQSYPSMRFVTNCHNCYPSTQEDNFAVCTIRTRPERSIHCAVYAKNFYQQFFGTFSDDFLHQEVLTIKHALFNAQSTKNMQTEQLNSHLFNYGTYLFNYLFDGQFISQSQQVNTFSWGNSIDYCDKIHFSYDFNSVQDNSMILSQYAQIFMASFIKLVQRRVNLSNEVKAPETYDKDDEDCSLFVFSLANLRILNFRNQTQSSTKMKNLTLQQSRRMIGKLIPAIASTNSIAASLEINSLKDFLLNDAIPPKYMTISPFNEQKISFSWLSLPNPLCETCSPKNLYFHVRCSLGKRSFEQLEQFAFKSCCSHGRDLYCGNLILIKNLNAHKISPNKKKMLNFKPELLAEQTLTVRFLPSSQISDLNVQIVLIDNKELAKSQDKFEILNLKSIKMTIEALKEQKTQQMHTFNTQKQNYIQSEKDQENDWQEVTIE